MANIDLQADDASHEFDDGAIFERLDSDLSGTGTYDPFLTIQHKDQEAGYNTDETGQLDNVYANGSGDGRTNALLLSSVPIVVVDGVAYYEFRLDINENNSDPVISVEQLEIYASSTQATSADYQGLDAADAFLASDGFTKVFDLGGDRMVLSDVDSTGSGRDDYRFLIPVENFGDVDPSETYITLYTEMGLSDTAFDSTATFEEWGVAQVPTATVNGVKFLDVDRDGVLDQGEQGLGGVTVFIDADRDGVFDDGEASTVTAADGSFHFDDVTSDWADGSVWVAEVVPTNYDRTTGDHEVAYVAGGGEVSVEIGNALRVGDIHGTKTADTDNDGDGDVAVEGWTIYLYADLDADGVIDAGVDYLIATTITDAQGNYSFEDLPFGTYIVKEESRDGWQAVTPNSVGAIVCTECCDTEINFVNEQLGSISGSKLADTNNDDIGDVGVAGWTIRLYEDEDGDGVIDSFDNLLATTVTDAQGNYSFENLGPGNYIVKEANKTGWVAVTPTKQAAVVTAGANTDVDFVNEQLGSISGTKFADTDNDDDGDVGVQGWTVRLYKDVDGDGEIDAGVDTLIATTATDASGNYSFGNLTPGDYIVQEETKAGWQNVTATTVGAEVSAGHATDVDFVNEELGSISGTKTADTDNDNDGDVGVADWTISLYADHDGDGEIDAEDELIATTTTDADGNYRFGDLGPGDYIVKEESKSGWQNVTPTTVGADVTAGGDTDVDFVNEQLGSISGTKFEDTDNDNDGDVGVQGWKIRLYEDEDGDGKVDAGVDDLIATAITDANGNYSFEDLAPGSYIVREASKAGWQAVSAASQSVTVTAGGDTDVDFVNERLGSICGTKTADTDNDDDGDVGVQGWTIRLYKDVDGDGETDVGVDTLIATTTTDANGDYRFSNLAPGDYIVQEETRSGWQNVTATIVGAEVVGGQTTDVDFVNEELGSISGTKLEDIDNDDDGDVGVEGWTIELYADHDGDGEIDADDELLASTTTDAEGNYSFDDLAPGDYIVKEESKSGWTNVSATVVGAEVSAGGDADVDFVNERLGSISGTKFADIDNDDDGDVGVEGWTIRLYADLDGDGVIDPEDTVIATTTTDADGNYSFTGLASGDYIVEEETRSGWQAVSLTVQGTSVDAGQNIDIDFVNEELGSISGTKFADTDNDDNGDVGVEGWAIELYADHDGDGEIDAEDELIASTTTDADGNYSFDDLAPGDYIVKEESRSGWQNVSATVVGAEVAAGGDTDIDFVNEELGSISGTKTADTDNDDDGDVGVDGWTIWLYQDVDGDGHIDAEDSLVATTTTDADGNYSFDGLAPGDYIVKEASQSGWQNVSPITVAADVVAGQETDVDFVNEQLGSISGTKLADTDNDDDGDVGVDGWTIWLYEDNDGDGHIDADDELIATTTTDIDGNYSFDDLAPGDYIVKEASQSGWQNVSPITVAASVTASGETDVDFVNEQLGSITGSKFADTDNDDDGDVGVEGWTIELYADHDGDGQIDAEDELLATTTTDADGNYSFGDLAPGDYIVQEESRSGWQAVSATVQAAAVTAGGETDIDFVNEELGSLSGAKYADLDNDDDGDVGIDGWTIELYADHDGDGQIDAEDELLASTTTDADGHYSFDDLDPGDYIVKEESRSGWQNVTATVQGAAVGAGADTVIDFVNEELGSISGSKFSDLDNDGTWDAGEPGLQGWTISLFLDDGDGFLDAGDTLVGSVQTNANGDYAFNDLAPGDYIVVETMKDGWMQTSPNGADADPESLDVNGGAMGKGEFGYLIELSAGEDNGDNDFGNYLIPGPGVRTPGFWGSPNGLTFWDGVSGNETKSGPGFPDGELAPGGYLILGDDGDGIVETGELQISVADAQKIINASNKDGSGAAFMLARDVIASTLNGLAGNPLGDSSDTGSPAYYIEEGVDWLIKYVNGGQSGANALTLDDIRDHVIKTNSAAWTVGTSDDGIDAGSVIHSQLDEYNNTGAIDGVQYAQGEGFFI